MLCKSWNVITLSIKLSRSPFTDCCRAHQDDSLWMNDLMLSHRREFQTQFLLWTCYTHLVHRNNQILSLCTESWHIYFSEYNYQTNPIAPFNILILNQGDKVKEYGTLLYWLSVSLSSQSAVENFSVELALGLSIRAMWYLQYMYTL